MKASQAANSPDKKRSNGSDEPYGEDKETEDARMAVASQFYMGSPNTSPHSQGPSISSEAFLFLKNLFRRRPRDKSRT